MHSKRRKDKHPWLMILVVVCLVIAGAAIYGQYGEDGEEESGVTLYKDAEFKGLRKFVKVGLKVPDLNKISFNDVISSIGFRGNVSITIYEHPNYGGASVTISDDIPDLAEFTENIEGNWNDKISSVKVFKKEENHKDDS